MSKRMQEYLNSGAFDEAEEKLMAKQDVKKEVKIIKAVKRFPSSVEAALK